MFDTDYANTGSYGYEEYDDAPFEAAVRGHDFCRLTRRFDPISGAAIVEHADPCACLECSRCGWMGPADVDGWERAAFGDYTCGACADDDAEVAF